MCDLALMMEIIGQLRLRLKISCKLERLKRSRLLKVRTGEIKRETGVYM
jgi:hypothetical protein